MNKSYQLYRSLCVPSVYEIADDKGVIYSFSDEDEAWSTWKKYVNNEWTIQPETFGDIKLVRVMAITR